MSQTTSPSVWPKRLATACAHTGNISGERAAFVRQGCGKAKPCLEDYRPLPVIAGRWGDRKLCPGSPSPCTRPRRTTRERGEVLPTAAAA